MIHINFHIHNPWDKKCHTKVFFAGDYQVSENKTFDISLMYHRATIIDLEVSYRTRSDHAGLNVTLAFLGLNFQAVFHDNRHWNYDADRWNLESEYVESEYDQMGV